MEITQKIQKDLQNQHIEREDFEDRIIFMSMFKDIDWTKKKFSRMSFEFRKRSRITQTGFRVDIGLSYVQEKKTHGVERTPANLKEVEYFCWCHGGKFQQKWRSDFPRCQSVESRILEKGGRCTINFNAESSNAELLFRTIHSANQLSIYEAASRWCEEFARRIPGRNELIIEKSVAKENEQVLKKKPKPQEVSLLVQTPRSNDGAVRECLQRYANQEKDPIYESLCRCSIREQSLYWDDLQYYS